MISSGNRIGLVSYGTTAQGSLGLTDDNASVLSQVGSYQANAGQTCISCAINKSVEFLKDSPNARFIVLMSDGAANMMINVSDSSKPGTYDDAGAKSEAIQGAIIASQIYGISIYTVGFGSEFESETLKSIANNTGGKFYYGSSPDELKDIYSKIAIEIAGKIDSTNKVYGNNSMKIDGGQGKMAESFFVEINSSYKYMLANYLRLHMIEGNFTVEFRVYDSSYANIANITAMSYSSGWDEFKKEVYSIDFSGYSNAKYARIVYGWWNPAAEPKGEVWIDDVFFGPTEICAGSENSYKCGDMTITKTGGSGDLYPYTDLAVSEPQTSFNIRDSNCIGSCQYLACSPKYCSEVSCQ